MKYDLKKHNKPYCVAELAHLGITKETLLRPENQTKWIPAEKIVELSELLVEKPLSYTEIRKHYKNSYLVSGRTVLYLFYLCTLTMLFPVFSKNTAIGYIFADWKIIVYSTLFLGSMVICLFRYMSNRYYRIIKKTKKTPGKTEITYQVQTRISFKNKASKLSESKIKWRTHKHYWGGNGKEEAMAAFDKLTMDKLVFETPITDEKVQFRRPWLFQFLKEKNKVLYFNPVKGNSVVLTVGTFFTLFTSVACWNFAPEEIAKMIVEIPLVLLILIYIVIKIKIILSTSYLRVIKRRVKQGLYSKTSYHLQSCTTKETNKAKDWQDVNIVKTNRVSGNVHSYTYDYIERGKDKLMKRYYEKTRDMTPKVTEESIDA